VTVVPNQPPTLSLTRPVAGTRITAGATFAVEGTSVDDSGIPTTTVTFDGQTRAATSNGFSVTFTAPSVSETTFTLSATARDPEGNETPAVSRSLTVVPDVGGTPTVQLTAPAAGCPARRRDRSDLDYLCRQRRPLLRLRRGHGAVHVGP
jgi:hypothetical protein